MTDTPACAVPHAFQPQEENHLACARCGFKPGAPVHAVDEAVTMLLLPIGRPTPLVRPFAFHRVVVDLTASYRLLEVYGDPAAMRCLDHAWLTVEDAGAEVAVGEVGQFLPAVVEPPAAAAAPARQCRGPLVARVNLTQLRPLFPLALYTQAVAAAAAMGVLLVGDHR